MDATKLEPNIFVHMKIGYATLTAITGIIILGLDLEVKYAENHLRN